MSAGASIPDKLLTKGQSTEITAVFATTSLQFLPLWMKYIARRRTESRRSGMVALPWCECGHLYVTSGLGRYSSHIGAVLQLFDG